MELRQATPEDAAAVAGIVLAVAHHAYADLEPLQVHALDPEQLVGEWGIRLSDPVEDVVRVAIAGGRVVAASSWLVARRSTDEQVGEATLTHLVVHPAAQNAGVGGALLQDAEQALRALGGTTGQLSLHREAWWAARFLAARGWVRDEQTPPDVLPNERWRRTL